MLACGESFQNSSGGLHDVVTPVPHTGKPAYSNWSRNVVFGQFDFLPEQLTSNYFCLSPSQGKSRDVLVSLCLSKPQAPKDIVFAHSQPSGASEGSWFFHGFPMGEAGKLLFPTWVSNTGQRNHFEHKKRSGFTFPEAVQNVAWGTGLRDSLALAGLKTCLGTPGQLVHGIKMGVAS